MLHVLHNLTARYQYETVYGQVGIKRKGGLGFLKRVIGRRMPEQVFLSSLDLEGKTVYDIGGYIGLLAVFFAKSVGPRGQVVVFEPNQQNCHRIQEHFRLNRVTNATLIGLGVGNKKEHRVLMVRQNDSATGSMDDRIQSQIVKGNHFIQLRVEVDTLDNLALTNNLPKPDFIKIDIERMEYYALLGMAQIVHECFPSLYIEIHGADEASKAANIRRIVELLQSCGYSILYVESKQNITGGHRQVVLWDIFSADAYRCTHS